jgi:hypothetical protein
MSGRKTFTAGDVLTAADVQDYLMDQSVMVFAGTAARASAIASPTEGMVTYRTDDNIVEAYDGSSWATLSGGGKILQVVSTTYTTQATTTSASFSDTGLSASITPTKNTSNILVLVTQPFLVNRIGTTALGRLRIVRDSTAISSGAAEQFGIYDASGPNFGIRGIVAMNYLDSPATTSATTYKTQFYSESGADLFMQYSGSPSTITLMEVSA